MPKPVNHSQSEILPFTVSLPLIVDIKDTEKLCACVRVIISLQAELTFQTTQAFYHVLADLFKSDSRYGRATLIETLL